MKIKLRNYRWCAGNGHLNTLKKAKIGNKMGKVLNRKKGFLFSIDSIIAVTVLFFLISSAVYFTTRASKDPLPLFQSMRIGSDILAMLDYQGLLASLSAENISLGMNSLIPVNHEMTISIECSNKEPVVAETSDLIPVDRYIGAGKRVFVAKDGSPCIAGYQIWLK